MRRFALLIVILWPLLAQATALQPGQRVPAVGITDRGELLWQNASFSYRPWNSAQLIGKVRVIQHIAGRSSAKAENAPLIEAIKAAQLPRDRYQTTTLINTDDALPGTGLFVSSSIESNKRLFPWSQFIVDEHGIVRRLWQLKPRGSAIVVVNQRGEIALVKEGALTREEVKTTVALVQRLIAESRAATPPVHR